MTIERLWLCLMIGSLLYLQLFAWAGEVPNITDIVFTLVTGYGAKRHRWKHLQSLSGVGHLTSYIMPSFDGALSVTVWVPRPIFLHLMMLNLLCQLSIRLYLRLELINAKIRTS